MKSSKVYFVALIIFAIALGCGQKQSEDEIRQQASDLEKEEQFDEAFKIYEKQLEAYPDGQYAGETLQKVAFMQYNNYQDFEKAIATHKRLIEKHPESRFVPQARFMIGYIYANELKDYDLARVAYEEFLAKHSDNELAESVKWELEHLGEDVNEQMQDLFSNEKSNGKASEK